MTIGFFPKLIISNLYYYSMLLMKPNTKTLNPVTYVTVWTDLKEFKDFNKVLCFKHHLSITAGYKMQYY